MTHSTEHLSPTKTVLHQRNPPQRHERVKNGRGVWSRVAKCEPLHNQAGKWLCDLRPEAKWTLASADGGTAELVGSADELREVVAELRDLDDLTPATIEVALRGLRGASVVVLEPEVRNLQAVIDLPESVQHDPKRDLWIVRVGLLRIERDEL